MIMERIPKMIDLARTTKEMEEASGPMSMGSQSKYDYGLCLCFNQETLDKLSLETNDVEPGDFIHLFGMAEVTSVSKNDTGDGPRHRIELQLTHLGIEGEDEENEEVVSAKVKSKKMYRDEE